MGQLPSKVLVGMHLDSECPPEADEGYGSADKAWDSCRSSRWLLQANAVPSNTEDPA
jgi:hypothetical protein